MTDTIEKTIAERRVEIAKRMHIAEMNDEFHILEIPGADGAPFKAWPGPFWVRRAAALFLERLLDAYAEGNPELAFCDPGFRNLYEQEVRLLEFLEKKEGIVDPRGLAQELCHYQPWICRREMDGEIPF